jgi:CheY-like chemotaxis protein
MTHKAISQPHRILVIDDDFVCRQFCIHTLVKLGYETFEAGLGHEALELLSLVLPQIVLIDMHLPDMTACSFMSEVSSSTPHYNDQTQFIGMTGDDTPETLTALFNSGCCQVLLKPFNKQTLVEAVSRAPASSGLTSATGNPFGNPIPDNQARPMTKPFLEAAFQHELSNFLPSLDRLISTLDWGKAEQALHRMAGAAAFSGYPALGKIFSELRKVLLQSDLQQKSTLPNTRPLCHTIAAVYLDLLRQSSDVLNQSRSHN